MANTTEPVSGLSADCSALALDGGRGRGDEVVTVSFVGAGQKADFSRFNIPSGSDEIISEGWSAYEIERTMAALATISNYINISFEFTSDSLAGAGNRDTITDFQVGTDNIDLTNFAGLSFSGDITLSVSGGNTLVGIDTNGDNTIDMEIFLNGATALTAGDFLL